MSKDAPGADGAAKAADPDKIYEEHETKLIIRLITVGAYMFSVSFAAIALSGYYIFLWHPPNSRLIHAHAAHLRADSEMDFLVPDSQANNKYKYLSSPVEGVTEDNRFTNLENDTDVEVIVQRDEELTREAAYVKNKRLHDGRTSTIKKVDSNMINIPKRNNYSASSLIEQQQTNTVILTAMDKENETNFSANRIISNQVETVLKPSQEKLSDEDSKSVKRELDYSSFGNTRIHKKFFKIL